MESTASFPVWHGARNYRNCDRDEYRGVMTMNTNTKLERTHTRATMKREGYELRIMTVEGDDILLHDYFANS